MAFNIAGGSYAQEFNLGDIDILDNSAEAAAAAASTASEYARGRRDGYREGYADGSRTVGGGGGGGQNMENCFGFLQGQDLLQDQLPSDVIPFRPFDQIAPDFFEQVIPFEN